MKKTIRERLREWRRDNDVSVPAVAGRLRVSPRTVESWEQGARKINARTALQIEQMMDETHFLEIPLTDELRDKLKRVRKAGHDPVQWAADVIDKMLP
jgi:predicted transcriptional regulator